MLHAIFYDFEHGDCEPTLGGSPPLVWGRGALTVGGVVPKLRGVRRFQNITVGGPADQSAVPYCIHVGRCSTDRYKSFAAMKLCVHY